MSKPVKWRCYCPISLCRVLDPYGIRHVLAYIERTYGHLRDTACIQDRNPEA